MGTPSPAGREIQHQLRSWLDNKEGPPWPSGPRRNGGLRAALQFPCRTFGARSDAWRAQAQVGGPRLPIWCPKNLKSAGETKDKKSKPQKATKLNKTSQQTSSIKQTKNSQSHRGTLYLGRSPTLRCLGDY